MAKRPSGYPRNAEPAQRHDPADNTHSQKRIPDHKNSDHVFNHNAVQHPANQHDKHYDNDATGWVRACRTGEPTCNNEDATTKPFFDKGNAWRSESKGNTYGRETVKDYSVDHNRHHTEFELRHNAGMTHEQQAHDFSKRHVPQYEKRGEMFPVKRNGRSK
jgi:hypothetical protein